MLLNKLFYQSPGVLSANTLPVRAALFNFASEADALAAAGTPEHGEYYKSLNGKWHFRYLENPNELTEDDLLADLSAYDTITVPGAWTLQGYDKPHYTNVNMPYKDFASFPAKKICADKSRRGCTPEHSGQYLCRAY